MVINAPPPAGRTKRQLYFARMAMANSETNVLIVGFGDIGERVANLLRPAFAVTALIRNPERAHAARACGATTVSGDLSDPRSLSLLCADGSAPATIFHFAPPPSFGTEDQHSRNLLLALNKLPAGQLPTRLIYISTTGVYGDCGGVIIDETRPVNPQSDRAIRRVDGETVLTAWAQARRVTLVVLRAPGIYAIDRLPLARLRAGTPAINADEDGYTNHIHADDLAAACVASVALERSSVLNIVDDSNLKMGDYFDQVAARFDLPRPPRISRHLAESTISPAMLSFMRESRRIQNTRMKEILKLRLRYPTVTEFLATLHPQQG